MEESIIEIRLMQGDYMGCIRCNKTTSKLISYKIIREELSSSFVNKIKEINYAGVYILFGTNDEGKDIAYIGKSQHLLTRIKQPHNPIIDDNWSMAIIITTIDDSLDATRISYFEKHLINKAEQKRYILVNANEPDNGNPSDNQKVTLNKYIDEAKSYVQILGYLIFVPLVRKNDKIFNLINSRESYDAKGVHIPSNNHFIVLKGSRIQDKNPTSGTASFVTSEREKNKSKVNNFITLEDIEFTSPSVAASFVIGQNTNGPESWKLSDGMSLKSYINQ